MPKQRPATTKLKAKKTAKAYIRAGLNQSRLARKRGVHRRTINKQVNSKAVQDCLKNYLDSDELKKSLTSVAKEGLSATKVIIKKVKRKLTSVDSPDHKIRHSFWHDLMNAKGHIKDSGGKVAVQIFTIGDIVTQAKELENVPARSKSR